LEKTAISLFQASGNLIPRTQMLAAFLDSLSRRLLQPIPEAMKDWRNACLQLGHTLILRTGTTEIAGVAETLDDAGHLHLRLPNGTVEKFASGETDFPA